MEKNSSIGGRVSQLYKHFPKLCRPTCGQEINLRRLKANKRIRLLTMAEVTAISGTPGDYTVSVTVRPRYVNENCTACYRRLLAPRQRVMDLMAGWHAHLPASCGPVLGVDMNAEEMADNPQLDDYLVHDLSRESGLPIADESFDAVVNSVSIEYLVQPVAVLRDVCGKLKRGGQMIITFSDRYFPPKAIRLWQRLHPVERVVWVAGLMQQAGFQNIHTLVEQGVGRPPDDRYAAQRQEMDPLLAVWGLRT